MTTTNPEAASVAFIRRLPVAAVLLVAVGIVVAVSAAPAAAVHRGQGPDRALREVILVGNNWGGTADVIGAHRPFRRIARLDIIPDRDERMVEILLDPVRTGFFLGIRQLVGEGHDQFVDDLYTTKDGRLLIVSRPSFADVVAIRIRTGEIVWRFPVDGQRSDHMAMSPDGKHVAVSASTGNVAHILDTRTGDEVGRFPSGDSPHENIYSRDGKRIYHASIGHVWTPADHPALDSTKGERYFQVVDAESSEVLKRIDIGEKLDEAGYPEMSSAVRPMAISRNERWFYLQVSFFHGFVEYDMRRDRVRRVANLPILGPARGMPREQYILDSAHHGIAISGDGRSLCVSGTMSDYAALVDRRSLRYRLFHNGKTSYWSTTSRDGRKCYVSWAKSDKLSIFNYRKRKEIASVPVGFHPQRVRTGDVRVGWLRASRACARCR